MSAFFGWLFDPIIALVKGVFLYGSLGVAVVLVSGLVLRFISGVTGWLIACGLGAAIVIGASGSAYFGAAQNAKTQAEIAQLKFDKAKVEQDLAAQVAANAKQDEIEAKQAKQIEADQVSMEKLAALIKSHEGDASACVFPDELNEIFK